MKKSKLFLSLMSLCFSLAVLCFGVYAANQVNYSISGNITYEVSDAYVSIDTTLYKSTYKYDTASEFRADALLLESTGSTSSLSGTVTQVSLTNENGVNRSINTLQGDTAGAVQNLDLEYSTSQSIYAYFILVNVQNLSSSVDVYVKITDILDPIMDIIAYNSFIYRTQDIIGLQANDSTGGNVVIGFALFDQTKGLSAIDISYKVEVGIEDNYNPLKADTVNDYFYVEMGDYYGLPIRWKLIGTNSNANYNSGETTFAYFNNSTYFDDQDDDEEVDFPTEINGVFYQETCTGWMYKYYCNYDTGDYCEIDGINYLERDEYGLSSVTYNAYVWPKENGGDYDDYGLDKSNSIMESNSTKIPVNNYFSSNVRNYLNFFGSQEANKVYKQIDWSEQTVATDYQGYLYDTSGDSGNLAYDFNIASTNYVYSHIQGRALSDMASKTTTGSFNGSAVWTPVTNNADATRAITNYAGSGSDKFWLLSVEEALVMVAGGTANTAWTGDGMYSKMVWGYNNSEEGIDDYVGSYFFLRSPDYHSALGVFYVTVRGDWDNDYFNNDICAARAAFQLAL